MTTYTLIGETPFRLVFGSKAIILVEVGLISYRLTYHDEGKNKEGMRAYSWTFWIKLGQQWNNGPKSGPNTSKSKTLS